MRLAKQVEAKLCRPCFANGSCFPDACAEKKHVDAQIHQLLPFSTVEKMVRCRSHTYHAEDAKNSSRNNSISNRFMTTSTALNSLAVICIVCFNTESCATQQLLYDGTASVVAAPRSHQQKRNTQQTPHSPSALVCSGPSPMSGGAQLPTNSLFCRQFSKLTNSRCNRGFPDPGARVRTCIQSLAQIFASSECKLVVFRRASSAKHATLGLHSLLQHTGHLFSSCSL